MVTVGRIIRPHGNRGHVVVASETDFGHERFAVAATLFALRGTAPVPLTVEASREYDGRWVVGFGGVGSIDEAEALRGLELRIPEDAMRPLPAGSYYTHDLVGCVVRTTEGVIVGTVERVDLGVGIPMLVLAAPSGEVLIPFTEAFCRRVDMAGRLIEIDPPQGLLDLNARKKV
jgi:16S rRNA processing protein RimM